MVNLGVVQQDSTVRFLFVTRDGSGGAVAPSTAFENADVEIYKDASATQRSSDAGITMTSPFDTVTGLHLLEIDTSDDTDAGFFAAGSQFHITIQPDETVDSQTVVEVLATFQLESDSAKATRLLNEYVYPTHVLGTQTGVSDGSKINLSAQVDAQTPANSLRGSVWLVRDATDGRLEEAVVVQNDAGGLCTVRQLGTLDDLSFTPVATADFAWRVNTLDQRTAEGVIIGKASGTPTTTQSNSDLSGFANDELIGRTITWISGTADGQQARITDYASTSGDLDYTAVTTAPASGDLFKIT